MKKILFSILLFAPLSIWGQASANVSLRDYTPKKATVPSDLFINLKDLYYAAEDDLANKVLYIDLLEKKLAERDSLLKEFEEIEKLRIIEAKKQNDLILDLLKEVKNLKSGQ